jgi:hypothetical protein
MVLLLRWDPTRQYSALMLHGSELPVRNETVCYWLQANNCVEEKEWIDILTKICQTNKNRLKQYHPSAYINGHWKW